MTWADVSPLISVLPNAHRIRRLFRHAQRHPARWRAGDRHWEGRHVVSKVCSDWSAMWTAARVHANRDDRVDAVTWTLERAEDLVSPPGLGHTALTSAVLFLAAYDELGFLLDPDTPMQTIKAVHAMDRSCVLIEEAVYVLKGVRL